MQRYKLQKEDISIIKEQIQNPNEYIVEVMNVIAKKRGAIMSGGYTDEEKLANIIIDDFRTAKIGKITLEKVK